MSKAMIAVLVSVGSFAAAMSVSRWARLQEPWDLVVWLTMTIVIPVIGLCATWSFAAGDIRKNGLGWQTGISLLIAIALVVLGVMMLGVRG